MLKATLQLHLDHSGILFDLCNPFASNEHPIVIAKLINIDNYRLRHRESSENIADAWTWSNDTK